MAITTTYNAKAELDTGAARLSIRQPLATYDSNAHIFRAEIVRAGKAVDLTGAMCIGYFVRADGVTVPIDGAVEDNAASVTLAPSCYAVPGRFDLAVKLTLDDVVHTVMQANGTIEISQTDAMTSPGDGVQSFDKLAEAASKVVEYDERITAVEVEADRIPDAVRVNLASTADASFDGTANITPGVAGVLPLGNGGTDATDAAGARQNLGVPSIGEMQQRDRVVNLLDNSDFSAARFITQAGLNGKHGTTLYLGDRWVGSNSIAATAQAGGLLLSTDAQGDFIYQKVKVQAGKRYTLAIHATARTGAHRIAAYNSNNSVIYAQDYATDRDTLIVTFEAGEDVVSMLYYPGYTTSGGNSVLQWASLYAGEYTADTLPAYVYKGYADELAECQLHYENSWWPGNTYQQNQMQGFVASSNVDAYVSFKQSKRITPTITLYPYNPDKYTTWKYFNGTDKDAAGMNTVMRCGAKGFMVRLTPASGDTVTKGYSYAVDGHWEACADM